MPHSLTPEQLSGIEQHEKERKERCQRILKKYEKVKVSNVAKQKAKQLEEFSAADLTKKK
jgi:hypothetical protein